VTCTDCGADVDAAWKFCRSCGRATPVADQPTPVPLDSVGPSLGEGLTPGSSAEHEGFSSLFHGTSVELAGTQTSAVQPFGNDLTQTLALPIMATPPVGSSPHRRNNHRLWPSLVLATLLVVALVGCGWLGWLLRDRTHSLETTRATLAATNSRLIAATGDLANDKIQISTQLAQLASLGAEKTALTAQLKDAQTTLQGTQNTVQLQTQQITNLHTCLNGVLTALNYISYNDYTDAVTSLQGVQAVCQTAQNSL
jgi:hypothetical protein